MQFNLAQFAALGAPGTLDSGVFVFGNSIGSKSAFGADQHLLYNTSSGALFYDIDGVGGAAAVKVAVIAGTGLVPGDISLISGKVGDDTFIVDKLPELGTVQNSSGGNDTLKVVFSNAGLTPVTIDLSALSPDPNGFSNLKITGGGLFNLIGTSANNVLVGNAKGNVIDGVGGQDTVTGGDGADVFEFSHLPVSGPTLIKDFVHGTDHIALDLSVFDGLVAGDFSGSGGSLAKSHFISGAGFIAATSATSELIYNTKTGNLYYDADGNGSGSDSVLLVTLGSSGPHPLLSAADFHHI